MASKNLTETNSDWVFLIFSSGSSRGGGASLFHYLIIYMYII